MLAKTTSILFGKNNIKVYLKLRSLVPINAIGIEPTTFPRVLRGMLIPTSYALSFCSKSDDSKQLTRDCEDWGFEPLIFTLVFFTQNFKEWIKRNAPHNRLNLSLFFLTFGFHHTDFKGKKQRSLIKKSRRVIYCYFLEFLSVNNQSVAP